MSLYLKGANVKAFEGQKVRSSSNELFPKFMVSSEETLIANRFKQDMGFLHFHWILDIHWKCNGELR